jgi:MFS family permease
MSGGEQAQQSQRTMAMAVAALMMAHQVAGKASRDAIFLSHFNTSDLPAMVTAAAIAAMAVSIVGSHTLVRFGPRRAAPVAFALSSALQFVEWILLGYQPRIAACLIYLHVVAFGAALLSGFWSLMNEHFEPRSAKQLFGRISGMGTLGGLMGGLLAERVAAWFRAPDVVLLLTALHLACAVLLWRTFPANAIRQEGGHVGNSREATPIDAVQRYPFLLTLAGLVILASSGTALLDFVFKAQAAHTIGRGAPLLRFFGLYYTATSLLTFLLQTFVAPFCVKHAGLTVTAGTLPVSISLGSLLGLLLPGFPPLTVVRGTEILMRGSLYRSAYELFYTAIAPAEKRAVKSLIDVGADRMGDAVGSAGVTLMLVLAPGRYGPILALAAGVSMLALLLVSRLQRGYIHALEKSLVERGIELDPTLIDNPLTGSALLQSIALPVTSPAEKPSSPAPVPAPGSDLFLRTAGELRSGDAARAIRAASGLGPNDWAVAPLVIDLLAWEETMPAARKALERMGPHIRGLLVDVLLNPDADFAVRRRLPRVLAYLPSARTVEGLFAALEDQRFEVRFYAGRALYLVLQDRPDLALPPERVWAVINRELSTQRSVWNSHRLLDSRVSEGKEWFFDDELLDRADRNLEHLFTLLALLLPTDAVRIAFRALHTDDRQLKGTAFEYLESATPADTRQLLLPLLEVDAANRSRASRSDRALEKSLASGAQVHHSLKLKPLHLEARK